MGQKTDLHIKIDSENKKELKRLGVNISKKVNEFTQHLIKSIDGDRSKVDLAERYITVDDEIKELEAERKRWSSTFNRLHDEDISEFVEKLRVENAIQTHEDEEKKIIQRFIRKHEDFIEKRFDEYDGSDIDFTYEANEVFDTLLSSYDFTGKPSKFLKKVYENLEGKNE